MTARTFRLPAPDRTGWMFGLSAAQVACAGGAAVGAALALARGVPVALALGLLAIGGGVGLVRVAGSPVTAHAPQFALLDAETQDRMLHGWGDALRPFCRERSAVTQLRWSEWSARGTTAAHDQWVREQAVAPDAAVEDYDALLQASTTVATE